MTPSGENRSLRPIIISTFVALIGFGMMVPMLPLFARQFGAGGLMVGILLGANQVVDPFFAPLAGHISDRYGRKPMLLFAYAITAFAYLAVGLSGSMTALLIVWTLAGFGSVQILVTQAYIADSTSDEERIRGMGLWGAAFAVGFVIGPPIGALLFAKNPLFTAVVASGFSFAALIIAALTVKEPLQRHQGEPPRVSFVREFRGVVIAIIGLYFITVLVWSKVTSMLALYTHDDVQWDVRHYGLYLGLVGLAAALMQGRLIGPLAKRFGRRRLVVAGFALMGLGLALLALLPSGAIQALSALPLGFGFGILTPTLPAVLSSEVHPARKGRALGVLQSVSTLARIIAPVYAGILYDSVSHRSPFLAGAAISLITAVIVLPTLRRAGSSGTKG